MVKLGKAVPAGGDIRGNERLTGGPLPARLNVKIEAAPEGAGPPGDGFDHRERRRFLPDAAHKNIQSLGSALHLDMNAVRVVSHPSGQRVATRQRIDKGPKPDPCTMPRTSTSRRSRSGMGRMV